MSDTKDAKSANSSKSSTSKTGASASAGTAEPLILTQVFPDSGCGLIQLNRPHALNALNEAMIIEIGSILRAWSSYTNTELQANHVRFVVLTSTTPKAFCAGGDIIGLAKPPATDPYFRERFFAAEYTINHLIATYPKPIVSILPGFVMGGGVGLSVHGTFRVVTTTTKFAMPETEICLFPDVGGSWFLPRLKAGAAVGLYLGLTGTVLSAADCMWSGIGTHYVPTDSIPNLMTALTRTKPNQDDTEGGGGHAGATRHVSEILKIFTCVVPTKGAVLAPVAEVIRRTFGSSTQQFGVPASSYAAVEAALTAEANGSNLLPTAIAITHTPPSADVSTTTTAAQKFAAETLRVLSRKSPLSLEATVIMFGISSTPGWTLAQALHFEYRLAIRITRTADFREGVRAMVIDKDKKPKWAPLVSRHEIYMMFAPIHQQTDAIDVSGTKELILYGGDRTPALVSSVLPPFAISKL